MITTKKLNTQIVNLSEGIVVQYIHPTNTKRGLWKATLKCGQQTFKAKRVLYSPIEAEVAITYTAQACLDDYNACRIELGEVLSPFNFLTREA
jgi:hypothetical protein